ncbi:MAG: 16S rRNA (cytosine(967)-C(5))-methyltransferase RsmB, partial [Clostridium sp.]
KDEGKVKINFINRIHSYAFQYSLEPWMIKLIIKQYGEERAKDIMEGFNFTPATSVRVNDLKSDYESIYEELEEAGYEIEDGYICPESIVIFGGSNIENNKTFVEGRITVQDESAMLVAPLLDIEEGDTVLDLCSAPGGKATHAAELLKNTGKVIALDIHEHKLALIKENCERLGITNVECDTMDATKLNASLVASANKIILDVPCSGIGIIRRKPEIKWTKKRADLRNIVEVQREIMENAWEYLRDGGTMIYSTCTLNKEENEDNIAWFSNKHRDCKVEKIFIGNNDNLIYGEDGTLTVLPNEYMDGFYIAKLKKIK